MNANLWSSLESDINIINSRKNFSLSAGVLIGWHYPNLSGIRFGQENVYWPRKWQWNRSVSLLASKTIMTQYITLPIFTFQSVICLSLGSKQTPINKVALLILDGHVGWAKYNLSCLGHWDFWGCLLLHHNLAHRSYNIHPPKYFKESMFVVFHWMGKSCCGLSFQWFRVGFRYFIIVPI